MSGSRLSRGGLEQLARELGERDRAVLEMVGRLHLATGEQVRRAHWSGASEADRRAARRTLERLTNWRMLARLERRLGGLGRGSDSYTYALDVGGQRLMRTGGGARRPHLPRPAMWHHALTASEVYTRLVEALRSSDAALGDWQGEPQCWRRYPGPYGEPLIVKPDAFVRVDSRGYADLAFLEIDTGSQSRTVIRAKLDAYRRYAGSGAEQVAEGVFPKVVFLTTSLDRHAVLVDILATAAPASWSLFAVGLVEDSARLLLAGSP